MCECYWNEDGTLAHLCLECDVAECVELDDES